MNTRTPKKPKIIPPALQEKPKCLQKIPAAIFLDFDEVLNKKSAESEDEPSAADLLGGDIVDAGLITEVNEYAKKHNIPIIIVTSRPDTKVHKDHIKAIINQGGGFASDKNMGGFHEEDIHCLGIEGQSKKKKTTFILALSKTKLKAIEEIHAKQFPHLPKDKILFVDDDKAHHDPVKAAGYQTILAESECTKHLTAILTFMQAIMAVIYAKQVGFFSCPLTPVTTPINTISKSRSLQI
jgi:hypothetical protein